MKDYEYKVIIEGTKMFWAIIENRTEQVVGKYIFEEDAIARMKFLETGGAFNGFSPTYVIRKHNFKYTQ